MTNRLPLLTLALALLGSAAHAATEFSAAEQALFVDNHLAKLRPPQVLSYRFAKTGSMEPGFEDTVRLNLSALPDKTCCAAKAQFFTGARQLRQPEIEGVQGNPAILYFLERDIREMERLTKGKANYFRKRIRMAVFQGATIREVNLPYRGKSVAVREISIDPYVDDPNRAKFEKLAGKHYVFMLSDSVPGGLYGIRTRIDGETADAPAAMAETLLIDGAPTAPPQPKP
ncbi:hypothetical protein [Ideonella sp. A 288]|uniref:hypothetical protein n=1 Tax=Ideonella sp. A 288 TaxID=1962181 RepID=UPI000B4B5B7A|nr:hypothetical protein [Ideonella sp. A 288]